MASLLENVFRNISLSRNRQLQDWGLWNNAQGFLAYHQRLVIENWLFYLGYHNQFLERFEAEDDASFTQRVRSATIENHIKPIINLMVSHLYGKEDSISRYINRSDKPDSELNDILQRIVWNNDTQRDLDDSKALNNLVSGYSILKRELFDSRTGKPFPTIPNRLDVGKYGYINKRLLDSGLAMPLPWIDEFGIVYPEKLGGILYVAEQTNFLGSVDLMKLMRLTPQNIVVMEYVSDDVWLRWVREKDAQEWNQVTINPGTSYENKNQFGRVDVPFTVYKNTGDIFSTEGDSDIIDMKSLNLELNEHGNADKDALRYHGYPILKGRGFANLPTDFKRTKNAFIGLPQKDMDLEYLTWDGQRKESAERQDAIRRSLSLTTGVSLLSRGFMTDIGQLRSGPPLKALFTTDRAVMSRKFTKFSTYEKLDMRADLKFWEYATQTDLNLDNTLQFNAKFNDDFLGIDKLLEAEIEALEIGSGAESLNEILRDNHPDWTDEQIKAEIKLIQTAQQQQKTKIPSQSIDKAAINQPQSE